MENNKLKKLDDSHVGKHTNYIHWQKKKLVQVSNILTHQLVVQIPAVEKSKAAAQEFRKKPEVFKSQLIIGGECRNLAMVGS